MDYQQSAHPQLVPEGEDERHEAWPPPIYSKGGLTAATTL